MKENVYDRTVSLSEAALMIGLPQSEDDWWDASLRKESVAGRFDTPEQYQRILGVKELSVQLGKLVSQSNLAVDWPFNLPDVRIRSKNCSLLLFVSHLDSRNWIETGSGFVSPTDLWASFDESWNGALEIAGCYSETLRTAYEKRFSRTSFPALNSEKVLGADFWLSYYSRVYLPTLSRSGLTFGEFSITMIAATVQAIDAWVACHPTK